MKKLMLVVGMMLCGAATAVPKESTGATPVSPNVRGHEDSDGDCPLNTCFKTFWQGQAADC